MLEFINANNILYEKQFGFRQGHATSHDIMTLVETVTKALDTGKIVVGVYLDIRKAFDSISTSILLDKLYKIRIRGKLYCLLQSYLSSRTQYVMTLVEKVTKALDTGKIVVGVYLDIRKAFDCISTSILLDKLYKIGIRGNLYCLLQSYLSSRTQYVVYNECNSSTQSIKYGVPQGSILGPLLFILFMNDFSKASKLFFYHSLCG